jgi:hypothetical protein
LVEHLTFNQGVMGSNPIALTNETNVLAEKHQTEHPAEISQGNNWGNATKRPAAAPPLAAANWPRSHAREPERGRPINAPTARHCPRDAGYGQCRSITIIGF